MVSLQSLLHETNDAFKIFLVPLFISISWSYFPHLTKSPVSEYNSHAETTRKKEIIKKLTPKDMSALENDQDFKQYCQ